MRNIRLLEEAVIEATEAARRYEHECTGLGVEFAEAVEAALDLLQGEIVPLVVAIAHQARSPGYWQKRV